MHKENLASIFGIVFLLASIFVTGCIRPAPNQEESVIHGGTLIHQPNREKEVNKDEIKPKTSNHATINKDNKIAQAIKIYLEQNKNCTIIGKWYSDGIGLIFFKKINGKYFINEMEINPMSVGPDCELKVRSKNGKNIYIIKDFLEGNNLNPGVKLANEYTDYYVIGSNGDLYLYDSIGLIEKHRKID